MLVEKIHKMVTFFGADILTYTMYPSATNPYRLSEFKKENGPPNPLPTVELLVQTPSFDALKSFQA